MHATTPAANGKRLVMTAVPLKCLAKNPMNTNARNPRVNIRLQSSKTADQLKPFVLGIPVYRRKLFARFGVVLLGGRGLILLVFAMLSGKCT